MQELILTGAVFVGLLVLMVSGARWLEGREVKRVMRKYEKLMEEVEKEEYQEG